MYNDTDTPVTANRPLPPLAVAPMEGLTGFVFRKVHNRHFGGVDAYWIPFVTPTERPLFTDRQLRELAPEVNKDFHVVPQLLTRKTQDFIWAAKALADLGYDEVNLNVGCPAGTVVAKGKGAGFLREPRDLEHFLREIFSADLPIAVSVKTRLGWSDSAEFDALSEVFSHFPMMKSLTVHPRLKTDLYKGDVRLPVLDEYIGRLTMPVGYNGDIVTVDDLHKANCRFGSAKPLAHIMVGRALMADPALFRKARGGAAASEREMRDFMQDLFDSYADAFENRKNAMMRMKELWFFALNLFEGDGKLTPEKAAKAIFKCRTLEDFDAAVKAVFDNLEIRTDARYGWHKSL